MTLTWLASSLALLFVPVPVSRTPATVMTIGAPLPDEAPSRVAVSLRVADPAGLRALLSAQQDPASPLWHHWITPAEFGARFGQPAAVIERVTAWLGSTGLVVRVAPDRIYLEAMGTAAQVNQLFGIRLHLAAGAAGRTFRTFTGTPRLPDGLAPVVLTVQGLDTRMRFSRRLPIGRKNFNSFGPQDLRRFYDIQPLLDQGFTGRGAHLAVLAAAVEPPEMVHLEDIEYFYGSVSDTRAELVIDSLPNPHNDVDPEPGGRQEQEMDVELQTVAAPGAATVTLVLPPASEIFTTGIQSIVNDLQETAPISAVSTSYGGCELQGLSTGDGMAAEQLIQQGNAEGQTWASAAGDDGADDCRDGSGPAVDFPSSIPEIVAVGGTETNAAFDKNGAMPGWWQEVVWNDGQYGGAGGGGVSTIFSKPDWQAGVSPADGYRDLPDVSFLSSPLPGVVADNSLAGQLSPNGGTSDAAPLSAGIFALIGDRIGGRLGGVNPVLYALGKAQLDGGVAAFHDVTSGNNSFNGVTGYAAGPGFDLASGWGSLDVAVAAAAWPVAAASLDAGEEDAGLDAGADAGMADGGVAPDAGADAGVEDAGLIPYNPCALLACDGGETCETIPEGPSSCTVFCDAGVLSSCAAGTICAGRFEDAGVCVPGCTQDADCPQGQACFSCTRSCYSMGKETSKIGDRCYASTECPTAGYCLTAQDGLPGGYCTMPCHPDSCPCPGNGSCQAIDQQGDYLCFAGCAQPGDCRQGYVCQWLGGAQSICLPACTSAQDCSMAVGGGTCDVDAGVCVDFPGADAGTPEVAPADAGIDAGRPAVEDAGSTPAPDGGSAARASADGGAKPAATPKGCGCGGGGGADASALLALLTLATRRRRR